MFHNELCKQFSVHSYPKMLFFEKGVLKGRYNKNVYTPGVVAAQIARWMSVDAPKANPFGTFSTADYLSYSITGVLSHAMPNNFEQLMRIVEEFDLGQPLEPIAGSVEWLSRYDKTIFFISAGSVFLRRGTGGGMPGWASHRRQSGPPGR